MFVVNTGVNQRRAASSLLRPPFFVDLGLLTQLLDLGVEFNTEGGSVGFHEAFNPAGAMSLEARTSLILSPAVVFPSVFGHCRRASLTRGGQKRLAAFPVCPQVHGRDCFGKFLFFPLSLSLLPFDG